MSEDILPYNLKTVGIALGYAAMQPFMIADTAVSTVAKTVSKAASEVIRHSESSEALFGAKSDAISEIWKLANECAEPNWDGYEALALNELAISKTVAFIRALPDGLPMPEVAPTPDGFISLDWIQSRYSLFSLIIGSTDRIAYAWLDGTDKGHAVARFDGLKVPSRILEGIHTIVNHGATSLRVA